MHVNKILKEIKAHGTKKLPMEVYEDDCRVFGAIYTHWHKEYEMIFIEKGKGTLIIDQKKYDLLPDDIILIGKEQLHYIESDWKEVLTFKSIVFDQALVLEKQDTTIIQMNQHVLKKDDVYYDAIKEAIFKIVALYKAKEEYHELAIKSYMFELVFYLLKGKYIDLIVKLEKSSDIILAEMIRYIEENYTHEIKSEQLAEMAGYSKFHFTKIFKEYTGKTVVDYIHQLRMNRALQLLETDLPISEVAFESGYDNVSYFIKRFKLVTGKSPVQYKKEVLNRR